MRVPSIHLIGALAFVALGASSLPGLLSAQVSDSALLRDEIRSSLQADPRSSALSTEEFDRVVESLAGEVETSGQTDDFVTPNVFYEELVPYPAPESRMMLTEAFVYGLVIFCLGLALLALRRAHEMHPVKAKA